MGVFFLADTLESGARPGSLSYSQAPPFLSSRMCSSVPTPPTPSVPSPQSHTRISTASGASAPGFELGERNTASLLKQSKGKVSGGSGVEVRVEILAEEMRQLLGHARPRAELTGPCLLPPVGCCHPLPVPFFFPSGKLHPQTRNVFLPYSTRQLVPPLSEV